MRVMMVIVDGEKVTSVCLFKQKWPPPYTLIVNSTTVQLLRFLPFHQLVIITIIISVYCRRC